MTVKMKRPGRVIVKSISSVSSRVMSGTISRMARTQARTRPIHRVDSLDTQYVDADPAFLADAGPLTADRTGTTDSDYTALFFERRQGGFFDSVDFGIPRVGDDGLLIEPDAMALCSDDMVSSEFEILTAPSTPVTQDYSPRTASFDFGGRSATKRSLRSLKATVRRMTSRRSHRSIDQDAAHYSEERTPTLSGECFKPLPHIHEDFLEVPALDTKRMSVASNSTTGTMARYLNSRMARQSTLDKSLAVNGMSILAYERRGSWMVHYNDDGSPYDCPFDDCEAHNPRNSVNSAILYGWHHRWSIRRVETVFEDI